MAGSWGGLPRSAGMQHSAKLGVVKRCRARISSRSSLKHASHLPAHTIISMRLTWDIVQARARQPCGSRAWQAGQQRCSASSTPPWPGPSTPRRLPSTPPTQRRYMPFQHQQGGASCMAAVLCVASVRAHKLELGNEGRGCPYAHLNMQAADAWQHWLGPALHGQLHVVVSSASSNG